MGIEDRTETAVDSPVVVAQPPVLGVVVVFNQAAAEAEARAQGEAAGRAAADQAAAQGIAAAALAQSALQDAYWRALDAARGGYEAANQAGRGMALNAGRAVDQVGSLAQFVVGGGGFGNAPNTLLGLGAGIVGGGTPQLYHGVLEFHGDSSLQDWFPGTVAVTLGSVVLYQAPGTPNTNDRDHETYHVFQSYFMGPTFLPFHGLNQLLIEGGMDQCDTPLENGPCNGRVF